MRILVITPKIPWPAHGADEADRLEGIRMLQALGHEVRVITKIASYQTGKADEMAHALGVPVVSVPYTKGGFSFKRLTDLAWLDGAAFEYTEPVIRKAVEDAITTFKPDLAWIDASFSWPLIPIFKVHSIRTIVRSLQIESTHILVDEGRTPLNYLRAFGKGIGERRMARTADQVVAINKNEAERYTQMGATRVTTIPLRSLPLVLDQSPIEYRDTKPLHILFSGSTFSVAHNREGAMTVFRDIAPALEKAAPGAFIIHVTGAKLPPDIIATLSPNVKYEGYVSDYNVFMRGMDIAITPQLGRVGMHQKLYEPLCRGIPTVTVPWALAGYPFEDAVLSATTARGFVSHILAFRDTQARETIGRRARALAEQHFSHSPIEQSLVECLL
jgi:hypothetical protein